MRKNANLPALIFLFVLLVIWQAGAMGMDAAYILPSPTQILVRMWGAARPAADRTSAGNPAVHRYRPCDLHCARPAAGSADGREPGGGKNALSAHRCLADHPDDCTGAALCALVRLHDLEQGAGDRADHLFFPIAITVFDGFRSAKTDMVGYA